MPVSHPPLPVGTPEPSRSALAARAVLVAELDQHWSGIVHALEFQGAEFDILAPDTRAADVVACATRADAIVIVDLTADALHGMTIIGACRQAAPSTPVIAVADNPSLALTRSVRLSGAFYLALRPVGIEEMTSVLQSAGRCLEQRQGSAITYRATRRILVVDDDPDFRASTTALLEAHGYTVSTAASGKQALERLKTEQPDLLVLDVMMEHDVAVCCCSRRARNFLPSRWSGSRGRRSGSRK